MMFDPIWEPDVDHRVLHDSWANRRVGDLAAGDAMRFTLETEQLGARSPKPRRRFAALVRRRRLAWTRPRGIDGATPYEADHRVTRSV
jgi:hypothetical protein